MRSLRFVWLVLLIMALAVPSAFAGPGGPGAGGPGSGDPGGPPGHAKRVLERAQGQAFCPGATLVAGGVVIPGGHCFVLSVMHNVQGTFLVFVPQGDHIPPGQLVRLNTPAGPKENGRIFLVPIRTTVVLVSLNTAVLVATRIEEFGPQTAIVLVGTPAPSTTVIFNVRM